MTLRQRIYGWVLQRAPAGDRIPVSPGAVHGGALGLTNRQVSPEEMVNAFRGWVYKAVNRRAEDIANVEQFAAIRTGDDTYTRLPRAHKLQRLLTRPNPLQDGSLLRYCAQVSLDLLGNAYIYQARNGLGLTEELWLLDGRYMRVVPDTQRVIGGYLYRIDGREYGIPAADIIHIKYPNPDSFYYGFSPLTAAAWDVDIDTKAKRHQNAFLDSNPLPRIAVEAPGFLLPMDAELLRERIMGVLRDPSKAGAPLISHMGAKISAINLTPQEIDYLSTRKDARDAILTIYGVPASTLGISEDVNRANAEAAHYSYALRVVEPKMRMWDSVLTLELAEEFGESYVVRHPNAIPEDRAAAREDMKARIAASVTSPNEERARIGMEPVAGGDQPLVSASLMPLADVTVDSPAGDAAAGAELGAPPLVTRSVDWTEKRRAVYWRTLAAGQIRHERRIAQRLRRLYGDQARAVLTAIGANRSAPEYAARAVDYAERGVDLDAVAVTMDSFREVLEELGLTEITLTMKDAWEGAMREIEADAPWSYTGNTIQRLMRDSIDLVVGTNETTKKALFDTLREGIDGNEDLDTLAERVLNVFNDGSRVRAKRIALTTATQATNASRSMAWDKESAIVKGHMWISSRDGKVRDAHKDVDGQKRKTGVPYDVGGEKLRYPGDPKGSPQNTINERCFEAPLTEEPK